MASRAPKHQYYAKTERATPSACTSSKFPYSETMSTTDLWFEKSLTVVQCCTPEYELYDLFDLGERFGLTDLHEGNHKDSAEYCKKLLEKIIRKQEIKIVVESKIPNLLESSLSDLACTNNQIPDLYLCLEGDVTAQMIIEVHSSPYEDTIRKCIIVATNLLRLHRMYDVSKEEVVAFTFPKLPSPKKFKHCVVKVKVTWKDFGFEYELTPLVAAEEVEKEILDAIDIFQFLGHTNPCHEMVLMKLSTGDLQRFGVDAHQLQSSSSIIVRCNGKIYKKPYFLNDKFATVLYQFSLKKPIVCAPQILECVIDDALFFHYDEVHYDPMSRDEAMMCLQNFFQEVSTAIETIHVELQLAHMDIRLENICFNDHFKAVFIDFDRCTRVNTLVRKSPLRSIKSCMIDSSKVARQNDYVQLGWMLLWILYPSVESKDYHKRDFQDLPDHLKSNEMLRRLILDSYLIETFASDEIFKDRHQTISSVLLDREN